VLKIGEIKFIVAVCGNYKMHLSDLPGSNWSKGLGCCALKSITASAQRPKDAPGQQVHSAGMLV
ncbi:MAG: hypothetical protein PWK00_08540, partial [Coxiella burnetii]|nr:hypothetical protein [Coxiella burnetii]